GIGNAFVILSQAESDISEAIRRLHDAKEAFEAAGYIERRTVVLGNLATAYDEMGLYRHATRLYRDVVDLTRAIVAKQELTYAVNNLLSTQIKLGAMDVAQGLLHEAAEHVSGLGDPSMDGALARQEGDLALAENDPATAVRRYQSAVQIADQAGLARD